MKKASLFLLILLNSFFLYSENLSWEVFQKAQKAMEAEDKDLILSFMSGDKHKEFSRLKEFKRLKDYLKRVQHKFIAEYLHPNKTVRFLVLERQWSGRSRKVNQVFLLKEGKWLWDKTVSNAARNMEDVEVLWNRELSEKVIYQMKDIGRKVAYFYAGGELIKIPNFKKMDIKESDLIFTSPENNKKGQILLAEGFDYLGAAENVLGVTNITVYGYYLAVFDDGHVEQISEKQYKQIEKELGFSNGGKGRVKTRPAFKNELDFPSH